MLAQPQSEVRRDPLLRDLGNHRVPIRSLRQRVTRKDSKIAALRECDLLVAADLVTPALLETQPFVESWRRVEGKRIREIERELQTNGWNLFYLIPDVSASGIARYPERAVQKAVRKILGSAVERGVNTLEIASIKIETLFGFHRANVTAKLRHIQESPYLFSTHEEMRQRMLQVKPEPQPIPLTPGFIGRSYAELHAILAGRTQ